MSKSGYCSSLLHSQGTITCDMRASRKLFLYHSGKSGDIWQWRAGFSLTESCSHSSLNHRPVDRRTVHHPQRLNFTQFSLDGCKTPAMRLLPSSDLMMAVTADALSDQPAQVEGVPADADSELRLQQFATLEQEWEECQLGADMLEPHLAQ